MAPIYRRGESGRVYDFDPYALNTTFKAIPGIYIIAKPGTALGGSIFDLYVGKASSLHDRLNLDVRNGKHDGYGRAALMGADRFLVHLPADGSESSLFEIETDLRRAIRPPCDLQLARSPRNALAEIIARNASRPGGPNLLTYMQGRQNPPVSGTVAALIRNRLANLP